MAIYVLDGSMKEIKVLGRFVSVKNNSGSIMYASSEPDLSPKAEKVLPVTAGESVTVPNCSKKVYVQGTGQVAIESSNYPYNFFNPPPKKGDDGSGDNNSITQQQLDEALQLYETKANASKAIAAVEAKNTAQDTAIQNNTDAISVLYGNSEGSVRKIVDDEIAKVVADAPEDFDTLKEMSDWINEHRDSAAAMNSQIQANTQSISENADDILELENSKANKSEIPTSLPANGGNADTVGGYSAENLIQSNPNLLDNPDFKINQRGSTHYEKNSNTFYTVDRWRCQKGFSVDLTPSGGVEIERVLDNTSSGAIPAFLQITPYNESANVNKGCIASIYVEEVSQDTGIYMRLMAYDSSFNFVLQSGAVNLQPGLNVVTLGTINSISSARFIRLAVNFDTTVPVGGKVSLRYAKIEYGAHATPFAPPDPTVELLKCQRYYYKRTKPLAFKLNFDYTNTSGINYIICNERFPVEMRIAPTIKCMSGDTEAEGSFADWATNTTVADSELTIDNPNNAGFNAISIGDIGDTPMESVCSFMYEASADL